MQYVFCQVLYTMEFIRHYHNSCQGDVFSVMEVRIVLQYVFFWSSFVCFCGLQQLWVIWARCMTIVCICVLQCLDFEFQDYLREFLSVG